VLTSAYELKFFVFWDALTKHRTDGALVRIITRVYEREKLEEADARLEDFARLVVPVLEGFVPGREVDPSR
jgi:EpsI family protein